MSVLKPCPFCGSDCLRASVNESRGDNVVIECIMCGCMGPDIHNQSAAIEEWNKRSSDILIKELKEMTPIAKRWPVSFDIRGKCYSFKDEHDLNTFINKIEESYKVLEEGIEL